ncbi:MAG: DUF47 domain-containing protein [Acidobacteria bacterium]|nr:DUF47 domain-containing protein [Acidobacteriota bacterium]
MFRLFSKDDQFFALFEQIAKNLNDTARFLVESFDAYPRDPKELHSLAVKFKDLEHKGDSLAHDLFRKLNQTFVTPLDREDIYGLTSCLDDVVDLIEAAVNRVELFRIDDPREESRQLAHILYRQTVEVLDAITHLRNSDRVLERCKEIMTLEKQADQVYREAVARMFDTEKDPIMLIKRKDIIEKLEIATDKCEDVANVLEAIILKTA